MSDGAILILSLTGAVILWVLITFIRDEREHRVSKKSRRDQQRTYDWKEAQEQSARDRKRGPYRRGGIVESNHQVVWNAPSPFEVSQGVDLTEYIKRKPIYHAPKSGREHWDSIASRADQDLRDAFKNLMQSTHQVPDPLKEMGISAEEAMEQMKRFAEADMPKPITDIEIKTSDRYVEVTRVGDLTPQYVKGGRETVILDQDGDEVPLQLEEQIREAFGKRLVSEMELADILGIYNIRLQVGIEGHFKRCPYPRDRKWACVCQPPTLFRDVYTYQCACCDEPVAHEKHGLCDVCEDHQYATPSVAEYDHERVYTG